jgi:hypothetical protein
MLFQEVTIQKPRSLPSELSMFFVDDQAQQTKEACSTNYLRPRGWSDVALGALFEMDFDIGSSADTDFVDRGFLMDIQGKGQQSCCFEREEASRMLKGESANESYDETAETVVRNKVPFAGRECADSAVANEEATSGASQSWACMTQRQTATLSVAIVQRKQQNNWRPHNTTR